MRFDLRARFREHHVLVRVSPDGETFVTGRGGAVIWSSAGASGINSGRRGWGNTACGDAHLAPMLCIVLASGERHVCVLWLRQGNASILDDLQVGPSVFSEVPLVVRGGLMAIASQRYAPHSGCASSVV